MTEKQKVYKITQEIADIFNDAMAARDCRDKAISAVWGTKRAIKFGKIYNSKNQKGWDLVFELYPELKGRGLTYFKETREVQLQEKE